MQIFHVNAFQTDRSNQPDGNTVNGYGSAQFARKPGGGTAGKPGLKTIELKRTEKQSDQQNKTAEDPKRYATCFFDIFEMLNGRAVMQF